MNYQSLKELFAMQRELDKEIVTKHEEAAATDGKVVPEWKFLALNVEIGECANEWRSFKVWSNDREPRTLMFKCENCKALSLKESDYCGHCISLGVYAETVEVKPLLEEAVDCLHFALSIGNDVGFKLPNELHLGPLVEANHYNTTLEQFNALYGTLSDLNLYIGKEDSQEMNAELYEPVLFTLLALTEKLGFTWEEIVEAYKLKNKVNHDRQNNGY